MKHSRLLDDVRREFVKVGAMLDESLAFMNPVYHKAMMGIATYDELAGYVHLEAKVHRLRNAYAAAQTILEGDDDE